MMQIREPKVAGMFYPSDPDELKGQLNEFLKEVELGESFDEVAGLVSPHAGYMYSGKTAAYAYKTIEDKEYKNIIVISPSHREYFPGISIYSGDAYGTPLGN
ncbi:MAG: AmmeMemoRadiSam system protein B, partial [Melioribacteraceae bacterium]|nr:AmmeMemoRadiSam system protein B [Melioribacteraceae bacterium]